MPPFPLLDGYHVVYMLLILEQTEGRNYVGIYTVHFNTIAVWLTQY